MKQTLTRCYTLILVLLMSSQINAQALNFDGTDDLVTSTSNIGITGTAARTVEAWIKSTVTNTQIVIADMGVGAAGARFTLNAISGNLRIELNGGGISGGAVCDGKWHHVAVTFNNTASNKYSLYIDGSLSISGNIAQAINTSASPLYVGRRVDNTGSFNGSIDELRVWNVALTQAQIQANMHKDLDAANETNLVLYYKLNETSGITTIVDSKGTNSGTWTGTGGTNTSSNFLTSYAPFGDATIQSATDVRSIWQSKGTSTSLESRGLVMSVGTALTETNYAVFGHNNMGGSTNSTDVTGSTALSKYSQVWYVNKIGSVNNTTLTFDLGTISGTTVTVDDFSDYVLLYRPGTSGNFVDVENASSIANSDQITFTGINLNDGFYAIGNNTLSWTGTTSTDWETATNWSPSFVPTDTNNVILPAVATVTPIITAHKTIKKFSLNGIHKVLLGDYNLTITKLKGGNSSSYFVNNGTGSLLHPVTAGVTKTFHVGTSTTSYDPVSINPESTTTFAVNVKSISLQSDFTGTIANFAKVAKRQWHITPSGTPGSTVIDLKNGGSTYTPTLARIGHYKSSTAKWEELAATYISNTWTVTTSEFSPFGVGDAGGFYDAALSVEFLNFTATPSVSGNLLTWTTAHEVNNKGFQVERVLQLPKGAFDVWDILGFVNAKGKSSTYDFLDAVPSLGAEGAYYRLRQLDNDGKETLSKVILVERKGNNKLKAYPNPVSNILTVETEIKGDFEILNLLGQQVLNGKAAQRIDVSALPQGAYFLKVGAEQVKFVKQ